MSKSTVIERQEALTRTSLTPHPNLSDAVNRNIVQSEIEGGVFLDSLHPATVLQIQTRHHCYTAVLIGGSRALLPRHPPHSPQPALLALAPSPPPPPPL